MTKLLTGNVILLLAFCLTSKAQPYKLFGGERQDQAFDIRVIDDKVVAVGNGFTSGPITITGFKLVTTKNLELISFAYYPDTTARESFFSFDNRQDTLFIAGSKPNLCCDSIYDNDAMLSIEVNGTIIDKRLFGGMYGEQFSAVSILDNYLYLFGSTYSYTTEPQGPNGCDPYVVKCDLSGNIIWVKHLGTTAFDVFYDATPDSAAVHKFLCVGGAAMTTSGDPYYDGLIVRMDTAGGVVWRKTFKTGPLRDEQLMAVAATTDGGGIAAGTIYDPLEEVAGPWLVCFDANGDTLWTRKLYRFNESESSPHNKRWQLSELWDAQQLSDGGFLFTGGWYNAEASSRDIFISKYSASGDSLWRIDLGGTGTDIGFAITEDDDGYIYVAGQFVDPNLANGLKRVLLVKLDANGCTVDTCLVTAIQQPVEAKEDAFKIYPNPADDILHVDFSNAKNISGSHLFIRDISGRPVIHQTVSGNTTISVEQFSSGVYIAELRLPDGQIHYHRFVRQ